MLAKVTMHVCKQHGKLYVYSRKRLDYGEKCQAYTTKGKPCSRGSVEQLFDAYEKSAAEKQRNEALKSLTELSEELGLYDMKQQKCKYCGRINTHRLREGIPYCGDAPAPNDCWEGL